MTNWLVKEKRETCKYLFAGQIANGVDKDKAIEVATEITDKIFEQYNDDDGYGAPKESTKTTPF